MAGGAFSLSWCFPRPDYMPVMPLPKGIRNVQRLCNSLFKRVAGNYLPDPVKTEIGASLIEKKLVK